MSKIVVLDAECGMKSPGRHCIKELDEGETREWFLNNRILDKIEQILTIEYDCRVLRVGDITGAKVISRRKRIKAANAVKADVYISLRHGRARKEQCNYGTRIMFYPVNSNQVNQAQKLYGEIVSRTGLIGGEAVLECRKYSSFRKAFMPIFLVENGFMDSSRDVPILLKESHVRKTARGIISFLEKEFGVLKKSKSNPVYDTSNFYYPKYTGRNVTLAAALSSQGIPSNYKFCKKIAAANGLSFYRNTYAQNMQLYNLLRAGILKIV